MSLLVPIALVGTTIAGLVTPFFLPKTEQEQATIDLNKKLTEGNFSITKKQPDIKVPSFTNKLKNQVDEIKTKIESNPTLGFGLIALIAIVILMVLM